MGATTVCKIVHEIVSVLWDVLQPIHMPVPTEEDFMKIADDFYELWNFPHCVGAIDGKHVEIKCPKHSGSMFYNYKHYFSMVLQGTVDANYKFVNIDVGSYGHQSDGGTFRISAINRMLQIGTPKIPQDRELPGTSVHMPYVLIADDAYPLQKHVLKPYSGRNLQADEEYFNMRLSRARRVVECAFGIIFSKWRILGKSIETNVSMADNIVKAICVLHNTVIDKEGMDHNLRDLILLPKNNINRKTGGRPPTAACHIRDTFKMFLCKNPINKGT